MEIFKKIKINLKKNRFVFLWSMFILLAISKLILISNNEILALLRPHDEMGHILAASRAYWFTKEYTQMNFVQFPIYSLFIFITHFLGIPLRIIIEILFILSGFLLSLSLIRVGLNKFLGIVSFALIIFQPISFELFDHTLAETLYTPLLLLSVASFINLWIRRNDSHSLFFSVSTGILFALLWFTRKESLLIAFFLFFVAMLIITLSLKYKQSIKSTVGIIKRLLIIPTVIIFLFYITICSFNYHTYGIFAPSELNGSGYKSAYKALQKIQTSNTIRYVPVSTEAREIAYSISPSFQKIRPILEDRNNFAFFWTKKDQGIENEMAAGWFYWMLRDATFKAGFKTATSADLFYAEIAREINSAIEKKEIRSRTVLFDFIDPNFMEFISEFPSSFFKISKLFISTQSTSPTFDDQELNTEELRAFDEMANRRISLVEMKKGKISTISGWAFVNGEKINSIALTDSSGGILTSTSNLDERPDVKNMYDRDNIIVLPNSGFSISLRSNSYGIKNGSLEFNTADNSFKIPIKKLKNNKLTEIKNGDKKLLLSIESKNFPKEYTTNTITKNTQKYIWGYYGKTISILSIVSLIILTVSTVKLKELKLDDLTIIIILISFIIITRISLFSLLDISSWNGAQVRYIFPVIPLYSVLLILILNKLYTNNKD